MLNAHTRVIPINVKLIIKFLKLRTLMRSQAFSVVRMLSSQLWVSIETQAWEQENLTSVFWSEPKLLQQIAASVFTPLGHASLGGLSDSFYEYLLKLWLYKSRAIRPSSRRTWAPWQRPSGTSSSSRRSAASSTRARPARASSTRRWSTWRLHRRHVRAHGHGHGRAQLHLGLGPRRVRVYGQGSDADVSRVLCGHQDPFG